MSDGRGNIQRPTLRSAVFLVRFLVDPYFVIRRCPNLRYLNGNLDLECVPEVS